MSTGFRKKSYAPELDCLEGVLAVRFARHDDDGRVGTFLPEAREEAQTLPGLVGRRKTEVDQEHVDGLIREREPRDRVRSPRDVERPLQGERELVEKEAVVLDDREAPRRGGHDPASTGRIACTSVPSPGRLFTTRSPLWKRRIWLAV